MSTSLSDRILTLIAHAEAFADEADDAGLHDISDSLRLQASRLAIDGEVVEAALKSLDTMRARRAETLAALKHQNHRLEVELTTRFPKEVPLAATSSRLPVLETARWRLRHLTPIQRAALGPIVPNVEVAIAAAEAASDDVLTATERAEIMKARADGRGYRLRIDLERSKAALLANVVDVAAADRIRRRVVRTRRPEARGYFQSRNSTDGEPIG